MRWVIYLGLKELRAAFTEGKEAKQHGVIAGKKKIQARRLTRARKAGMEAANLQTIRGFTRSVKKHLPLHLRRGTKRKTLLKQDVKLPKIF